MAEPEATIAGASDGGTPPSVQFDATLDHSRSTVDVASTAGLVASKQDRDLAFAMALLRSGHMTQRTLGQSTKNWTAFGALSLEDHLLTKEVISQGEADSVGKAAIALLHHVEQETRQETASVDGRKQHERLWLSKLDPVGRIAKMLGIADASVLSSDEIETRAVGARYTLLRKLGQGGLGTVWLARDENLQRYVAIKEMTRRGARGDTAYKHFRREAEITGRLEHPGIVPIYQYGDDEQSGNSFYVMRFLGKKTLQDALTEYHERCEAGSDDPMLLHHMLTAFVNVCQSVAHAHSRDVIHRDLKPENIALDDFGQVTLLDWGLAKINDETGMYDTNGRPEPGDLHSVSSTHVGRVLGTPLYMAPEQAAGRLDEVDELTDVYGLGGILYSILTGVAPHQSMIDSTIEGRPGSGGGASDVLSQIVSGSVTPPRDIRPNVPPELNAVCMKALARKRYLRFESATELAEDVQRHIAGAPVRSYDPPATQKVTRWMAAHPTLTQAVLLVTSLLLIGGAAIMFTARQGRVALEKARYAAVQDLALELEVNLQFETNQLERDLHFISELPLMTAITQTQRTAAYKNDVDTEIDPVDRHLEEPDAAIAGAAATQEFELVDSDEWLNRQGSLFDGLLDANPAYLVMATCMQQDDLSIRELVRSERRTAAGRASRVPKRQLKACPPHEPGSKEADILDAMRPGAVVLVTNDQISEGVPVINRSPLVLSGIRAVYDAEGEFFGVNVVELDLQKRLNDLFLSVAPEHVHVCVTDVHGNIVIKYQDGRFSNVHDSESILKQFPDLAPLFAADSKLNELGDGRTVFGRRVALGADSTAQIGIVSHIQSATQ